MGLCCYKTIPRRGLHDERLLSTHQPSIRSMQLWLTAAIWKYETRQKGRTCDRQNAADHTIDHTSHYTAPPKGISVWRVSIPATSCQQSTHGSVCGAPNDCPKIRSSKDPPEVYPSEHKDLRPIHGRPCQEDSSDISATDLQI